MTIKEAIASFNNYPVPDDQLELICIDRVLVSSGDYTKEIGDSSAFQLAKADFYLWLYTSPDLSEQEVRFTQGDRDNFLQIANQIYHDNDDEKFNGAVVGFIGDEFND